MEETGMKQRRVRTLAGVSAVLALCVFFLLGNGDKPDKHIDTSMTNEEYAATYVERIELFAKSNYTWTGDQLLSLVPPTANSYLEIGSGPCNVIGTVAQARQQTGLSRVVLVEPNTAMHPHCNKHLSTVVPNQKYEIVHLLFQDYACSTPFDVVVISHVLYHIPVSIRNAFLRKAKSCVAPGGVLLIQMASDVGQHMDILSEEHRATAIHIQPVREFCSQLELKCSYTSQSSTYLTNTGSVRENFENMYKVMYFWVVESAPNHAMYRSMDAPTHHHLEQKVRDYVWDTMHPDGSFSFEFVDEWMQWKHEP